MARLPILAGLIALVALLRLHTLAEPFERDLTTYAVIAHELLAGRPLYSDLWDHKPPAIHLTYAAAELVAGYGNASLYLLGTLTAAVTILGVAMATVAVGASPTTGLVAAGLFAVVCGDLGLQANQPNTEALINAAVVWAVGLLAADTRSIAGRRTLGAGLLFALGSLYKTNAAVIAAAVGIALVVAAADAEGRRRALRQVAVVAMVGLLAWAAVAGYFAWSGRFADFIDAVFTYNRAYAGDALWNLVRGLHPRRLWPRAAWPLVPLLLVAPFGLIRAASKTHRRGHAVLVAYVAGAYAATALPGHFYPHYYQLWLPVLGILAALVVSASARRLVAERPWAEPVLGLVVAATLLALQAPSYRLTADEWSQRKYGEMFLQSRATGHLLDRLLPPGATFYEWGSETGLYFWSRRAPPCGVFYALPLTAGPLAERLSARVRADLERRPPELLLFELRTPQDPANPVLAWARSNYRPVDLATGIDRFDFWVRRGGELDRRLPPPAG